MDGVGRGTQLGGRYRLTEPQHGAGERQGMPGDHSAPASEHADWRALDRTLDRDVVVRVVRGSVAEDVLDAGRRAAVVEDPRLQRVLDVGTHEPQDGHAPLTYVVFERVEGASLTQLLDRTPQLSAARVRAIVGETAAALARAADVGVHHGALRPDVVLRTDDGQVKVTGLAVDAITQHAVTSPTRGTAGDKDSAGDTVEIPTVDDGPTASRRRTNPTGESAAETDDAVGLVALLYAGLTGRWPLQEVPGSPSGLQPAPLVGGFPVPPDDLVGGVPNDLDTLCAVVFGPYEDGPRSPAEVVQQLRPWGPVQEVSAARPAAASPAPASPPAARAGTARPARAFPLRARLSGATAAAAPVGAQKAAADEAVAPAAVPAVAPGAVPAAVPGRSAPTADDDPFARLALGGEPARSDTDAVPAGSLSAAGPDAAAGPGGARHGDWDHRFYQDVEGDEDSRSRLVLVVVAVAVVLGLAFALNSLRGIGDAGDLVADPSPSAAAETEAPAVEEEAPAQETPGPSQVPVIAGIRTLDPEGDDGTENDDSAPRAIDDDPSSVWNSSTYASADFGGLKAGLGLALPLSAPALVTGATVTVNGNGGIVELRSAPGLSFDDSTVLATGSPVDGVVELTVAEPVEAANVLLWFTELPEVSGEFRIEVGQVQLR